MRAEVVEKIKATNQKYLSKLIGKEIPQKLSDQLDNMDWSYLNLIHDKEQKRGQFAPLGAMELPEIESKKAEFKEIGLEAIRNYKVGAILLAGGQGTRLGFDKAKGMYNIGVNKELYIFEQLICNLLKVTEEAGVPVPLYIMTSDKNDAQTREFFAEHDYFGYNKDFIKFFVQEMVPAVDFEGNVYIKGNVGSGSKVKAKYVHKKRITKTFFRLALLIIISSSSSLLPNRYALTAMAKNTKSTSI